MPIIIGMAGDCQQITDQNQWTTLRTGDSKSSVSLRIFGRTIETAWCTGECGATSCLSCSATLSWQFPRFLGNYTANVVFQGQDMHAFFIHHHGQARNVQELLTVPIFVTEKVHVGIERNRAIPTKWPTGSSRRWVGGIWWIDCLKVRAWSRAKNVVTMSGDRNFSSIISFWLLLDVLVEWLFKILSNMKTKFYTQHNRSLQKF